MGIKYTNKQIEELALQVNDFAKDFDLYEYNDQFNGNEEMAVQEFSDMLKSGDVSELKDMLTDYLLTSDINDAQDRKYMKLFEQVRGINKYGVDIQPDTKDNIEMEI